MLHRERRLARQALIATLVLWAVLLLPGAGVAKEDLARQVKAPIRAQALAVLSQPRGEGDVDELLRAQLLDAGDAAPLLALIEQRTQANPAHADTARWVHAQLAWRLGLLDAALASVEAMSAEARKAADVLATHARLLDALGREGPAGEAMARAVAAASPQARDALRVRQALLGTKEAKPNQALAAYASEPGRSQEVKNRAAIVLALSGHPKEALALFKPEGDEKSRYRARLRMAEWAVAAGDPDAARSHALAAADGATLRRDRRYGLAVAVEAFRIGDKLDTLIAHFESKEAPTEEERDVWIGLLRERERYDEAMQLFEQGSRGTFTPEMRRELLEMCRESGKEDLLRETYRELIVSEPRALLWREGLARYWLEKGDRKRALAVWSNYLEQVEDGAWRLAAAETLMNLGMDDEARRYAEDLIEADEQRYPALLFLFQMSRKRGDQKGATQALARLDELAPPTAAVRMQLADAYEQIGRKERAVAVLETLREARGEAGAGEDLEMRLAWLHSEVGNEKLALERWRGLWPRVDSVARRRYVEDRLMSTASRLGKLADIAIELEEKLIGGEADRKDAGLLVRLYTRANDAVSAAEVIEEFLKTSGGDRVKALVEKGRVFLACTDYYNYERTIRELMDVDPENTGDYLRQLAMSQLERGKPEEARVVLKRLKATEGGSDSAEFEAGVLALAGLREDAIAAYRRGLAQWPDRIETWLLLGNLLRDAGKQDQAIGMYQYLVEHAEKDDLFTVAIDGLLNMRATPPVLRWARRITMDRLTRRHDKMYLYRLLADLSEELSDRPAVLRALEGGLPISGERRSSLLRELMDLASGRGGDAARHLAYGRRLIGLGEAAPPQVYLELGGAFLRAGAVTDAQRTFSLATELPDQDAFQLSVAEAFEDAGYAAQALDAYERLLISRSGDLKILVKVAILQEQLGRLERARDIYIQAANLTVTRRALSTVQKKEEPNRGGWFNWARNVDQLDQLAPHIEKGFLATVDPTMAKRVMNDHVRGFVADLDEARALIANPPEGETAPTELAGFPRLMHRARLLRRMAMAYQRPEVAEAIDRDLLKLLPKDEKLLEALCRYRMSWGLAASARDLIADSGRDEEEQERVRFLVGGQGKPEGEALIPLREATGLFLPLLADGKAEEASLLLRRVDLTRLEKGDLEHMPTLLSAAIQLEDVNAVLSLGRHWMRGLVKFERSSAAPYQVMPILGRIRVLLNDKQYRSLCEYLVGLVIDDKQAMRTWMFMIPRLQDQFDTPLLTEDRLQALVDQLDGRRWFSLPAFLQMLPAEAQAAALRKVHEKVPPTQRARFLISLVSQLQEEASAEFKSFTRSAFASALSNVDANDRFLFYQFLQLVTGEFNQDLSRNMAEVAYERRKTDLIIKAALAVSLQRTGEQEKALSMALEVLTAPPDNQQPHFRSRAMSGIYQAFLPQHLDAFLARLDEGEAEGAEAVKRMTQRLDLVRRAGNDTRMRELLEEAVERFPDQKQFVTRLASVLSREGRVVEQLDLLERALETHPGDSRLKRQIVRGWDRLRHPVKALAVRGETPRATAPPIQAREGDPKKLPRATVAALKKAVDAEQYDEAAGLWHRMWRRLDSLRHIMGRRGFFPTHTVSNAMRWPTATTAARPAQVVNTRRGGLTQHPAYRKLLLERRGVAASEGEDEGEDPEEGEDDSTDAPTPPKPRTVYDVLAEYEFGRLAMRAELRTYDGAALSRGGALIEGLASARIAEQGLDATAQELIEAFDKGVASKRESALLLTLLERHPELAEGRLADQAAALSRSVDSRDGAQLVRLAKAIAGMGRPEEAARIFRWCGTRTSNNSTPMFVRRTNNASPPPPPVPLNTLVDAIHTSLEGDLRLETIRAVLDLSRPGPPRFPMAQGNDAQNGLILDIWTRLLEARQALEECRPLCERVLSMKHGLQRESAKRAAALYAEVGELDQAMRALELGICRMPMPASAPTHFEYYYNNPGWIRPADMQRLFPDDIASWTHGKAWLLRVVKQLEQWIKDGRVNPIAAFRGLAVGVWQLGRGGDAEAARTLLPLLEKTAGESPSLLLWVIDVARELDDVERARAIERRLLAERRLVIDRVAEVVEDVRDTEGADAALAAGEAATQWTLHPALLQLMARLHRDDLFDEEGALYWDALKLEADAAHKVLHPPRRAN